VKRSDRIAGRSGGAPACVSLHLQATQLAARSSSGGGNGGTPFRAAERVGRGCKMGVDGQGVAEGCKQEGGPSHLRSPPYREGGQKSSGWTHSGPSGRAPPSGQAPTLVLRRVSREMGSNSAISSIAWATTTICLTLHCCGSRHRANATHLPRRAAVHAITFSGRCKGFVHARSRQHTAWPGRHLRGGCKARRVRWLRGDGCQGGRALHYSDAAA
jgi:hypothetical protein